MVSQTHKNTENLFHGYQVVGSYPAGHTGARILRLKHPQTREALVAKEAPLNSPGAAEIKRNAAAYRQIQALPGAHIFLPKHIAYKKTGEKLVLFLDDLGANGTPIRNVAPSDFIPALKQQFFQTITTPEKVSPSPFAMVAQALAPFSPLPQIQALLTSLPFESKKRALMLLDFTPDNLFFTNSEEVIFIDPWLQSTYLGHPAISLGQFATLWQLYHLPDAQELSQHLQKISLEIGAAMEADEKTTQRAFLVGTIVQYTLSRFVRLHTEKQQAQKYQQIIQQLTNSLTRI